MVAHNDPARFDGLISIAQVDRIVTNIDLREGQLDLADASRTAHTLQLCRFRRLYRSRRGGGFSSRRRHHHLAAGAPDRAFARALLPRAGIVFSAHVQTNLYLTPPNAQGFKTHYDNHDVFVLQMEGEKSWRLYEKPIDTPFRGEAFHCGVHKAAQLQQEFVLKAGDCAYVPRGLMHDALTSGDAPSLHITVGLITRTWADLMLEAVSEVALRTPELRRSLPPGFAHSEFDRTEARAHLKQLGEIVARDIELDPALRSHGRQFHPLARRRQSRSPCATPRARCWRTKASWRKPHSPYRIAEDGDAW